MFLGADKNLRDWSGKKPVQYLDRQTSTTKTESYRSEYKAIRTDHTVMVRHPSKHQSFLRRGSTATHRRYKTMTVSSRP